MRYSISILLALLATLGPLEGAPRFTRAVWYPDLALALPCLDAAAGAPLDLPRAAAFLVSGRGVPRLEDRYNSLELWEALMVRGRWRDADGRTLTVARLAYALPDVAPETVQTRTDFFRTLKPLAVKDAAARDRAVWALAPVREQPPLRLRRTGRRNFIEILAYAPLDGVGAQVVAFRPRSPEARETTDWYLVWFEGAPDDDPDELAEAFETGFLDEISVWAARHRPPEAAAPATGYAEFDHLCEAYRRNVVNYSDWHFWHNADVLITDNLDDTSRGRFLAAVTNDLPRFRRAYAAALPAPGKPAFHPAAVRVFSTRGAYLAYVGTEARWTAAVWSPAHRELVLYLPESGVDALLRTVWHEAFHQYLAYAGCLLDAAPWINEGHAEYFEHAACDAEGEVRAACPPDYAAFVKDNLEALAGEIPGLLALDYAAFYAGEPEARQAKYRLAWSIAYFLEKGAPHVRFRPYETLRGDYLAALLNTRSGARATHAVLDGARLEAFVADWRAFWRDL